MDTVDDVAFLLAHQARARSARRKRRRRSKPDSAMPAGMAPQPAPVSPTQRHGQLAEAQALRMLCQAGLQHLGSNLRCKAGEIDLLMRDGETLVFVEVRTRSSRRFGGALASIGGPKRARLLRTARYFLQTTWRGPCPRCRFDIVAFDGGQCQWVRGAFEDGA